MRRVLFSLIVLAWGTAGCGPAPETADAGDAADAPRPIATADAGSGPGAAGAPGAAGPAAAAAAPAYVIVMIGDSLTGGHELPSELALPAQLEPHLDAAGFNVDLRNAGVANDSSAAGRARLPGVLDDEVDGVIIELGAVDMLAGVPVDDIRANLAAMIEAAQARDLWVGLVGMRAALQLDDAYQDAFNRMYDDLAYAYDVSLYPFYFDGLIDPETGISRPELFLPDGVHPTDAGVAVVAEGMADWLADDLPSDARATR